MMATATRKREKIVLERGELVSALRAVKYAVPTRSPKPILQNVLIADGVVSATDLELRIDVAIDAVTEAVLLPHARLTSILNESVGDEVRIVPGKTSCIVEIGRGRWTLPTEDAAEFPTATSGDLRPVCRLPADQLCRAIRGTVFATDDESSRYALGALLLDIDASQQAEFIGTDGRRLAKFGVEIDQAIDPSQTLIPERAALALEKLCDGREGAVQVETDGTDVVFECETVTVRARLVQGRFPRWRDVFPEREVSASVVLAGDLLAATRAAAIVTTEQSKGITYTFTSKGLHLHGQSADAGESSVTCDLQEFGQEASTKLDPRFVADFLQTLDPAAPVNVEVVDGKSAFILRHEEAACVVMPLSDE